MEPFIIPETQQKTNSWSGGTTTELFIYPLNASYADRDFVFRISTATIAKETSSFTSLPGISRILMILDGTLTISHKHRYSKKIAAFDTDSFDGSWDTTAEGKVTDFNLMMAPGVTGDLIAKTLKASAHIKEMPDSDVLFTGFYILSGTAIINYKNKEYILGKHDFMLLKNDGTPHDIKAMEQSQLVIPVIRSIKKA